MLKPHLIGAIAAEAHYMSTQPNPSPVQVLDAGRLRLERALEGFAPSRGLWLTDLVLLGYADELRQNAAAVRLLVTESPPLHAMPATRAAFEAAQNLLMLVSADDPAYAGALAWVYAEEKSHELAAGHPEAVRGLMPEEGGIGWIENAHRMMAEKWSAVFPGRGGLIHRAAQELKQRKTGKRLPDNWAGVNVAKELGRRLQQKGVLAHSAVDVEATLRRGYRILSYETHPRTIVRPLSVSVEEDGGLSTRAAGRDLASLAHDAANMTGASLILAALGVEYHRRRDAGA